MGLLSFMLSEEHSVASLHQTEAVRKKFAKESLDWNLKKNTTDQFEKIFENHLVRLGLRKGVIEPPKKPAPATVELGKREAPKKEAKAPAAAPAKKREAKEEEKKEAPAKGAKAAPAKPEGDFLYV